MHETSRACEKSSKQIVGKAEEAIIARRDAVMCIMNALGTTVTKVSTNHDEGNLKCNCSPVPRKQDRTNPPSAHGDENHLQRVLIRCIANMRVINTVMVFM